MVLSDGHTVHVRPIVPADAEQLVRFHERQSPESIYMRYFSPRPTLSQREVTHLCTVDHRNRVAFVALAGDELIAVSRYERYRGTDTAEVAFFVDDEHRGRGLATLMLEYLAAAATENGIRRFAASTLPNNRRMLKVFQSAGYDVASRLEDGVVELSFDIDPTDESVAAMDRRERVAEAASVRALLRPDSVAVVGAGRRRGGLGAEILHNLLTDGFTGRVHAVNPMADSVQGLPAYPSIREVPGEVDLAVIATPAHTVDELVAQCGERGVRAVLVVSAGFSEAGGDGSRQERRLVELVRRHGMRMLGPNCLGVVNTDPEVRLNATLAPGLPGHGRVAMMAEAGTLSASILEHVQLSELGVSTMVAAGNRADVAASDLLSYWTEDPDTGAVLLYLSARTLEPRFVRAARAASLHLPVAALHTSTEWTTPRLTKDDARRRAQALFRQTGVIGVGTLEQLVDIGRILADQPVPAGPGVAVIGNSDGAVSLAADACEDAGLVVVDLEVPGVHGGPRPNPADLTHEADAAHFASAVDAAAAHPEVHNVLVIYTPPRLGWDERVGEVVLDAAAAHRDVTFTLTMLSAADRARLGRPAQDGAAGVGVPIFRFPEDAAHALGRLATYRSWRSAAVAGGMQAPPGVPPEQVRPILERALARGDGERSGALDQLEQSDLLRAYGIDVLERRVVSSVEGAVAAAADLGWPVALKAATRDRLTRSVASGVVLDLADEAALRASWHRMETSLSGPMTPAVVQRFVGSGTDVSVVVRRDDAGSGVVEVGLGGPAAITGECELSVLPLTLADASTLVSTSAVGRVMPDPLDRVPVVELVHRLCAMVLEVDEIRCVRADPVLASPIAATIADVEIDLGEPLEEFWVRRLD